MKKKFNVDKSWTLFLDRDGVINQKIDNDYVRNWSEFIFINGALEAISKLTNFFGRIIIVTNQKGVGKGLMSEQDLRSINLNMLEVVRINNGYINKVYYCIETLDTAFCRKPNVGMAMMAKNDFPEINFRKSVIIGDSITDIEFGKRLEMTTIYITDDHVPFFESPDFCCPNLIQACSIFQLT